MRKTSYTNPGSPQFLRWTILTAFKIVCVCLFSVGQSQAKDRRDPTVGAEGRIDQIVLPGTELKGKPIQNNSVMIVRVVNIFPHGDGFRYDLQFHGLESGSYDLADYLIRKDGTTTDDLPDIQVTIRSLLPPGQIEPNPLGRGWLPRFGGYRVLVVLAIILWFIGLMFLIFWKRKAEPEQIEAIRPVTLADLLKPRLQSAMNNQMKPAQYAELERMLFAFWRKELGLDSETPEQALALIHNHQLAGPLMKQIEQWMHNPVRAKDLDLGKLLKPYQNMPASYLEGVK
ncbi:MAG: hypothetical protein AAGA30_12500 [Planctomycetota bacterium]